ncbi:hypothetical protein [Glycomyces albidus]|uniref:Uncharacterized protein n=1 Tax=Glycomyces albidus TaxID=2656774 RepID=A0A6L5GDX0_9ACTN|nr:hypothetical protein [Glycomyces albidus]MQM27663.1 hypothetical protein [Glycomyces albidus]
MRQEAGVQLVDRAKGLPAVLDGGEGLPGELVEQIREDVTRLDRAPGAGYLDRDGGVDGSEERVGVELLQPCAGDARGVFAQPGAGDGRGAAELDGDRDLGAARLVAVSGADVDGGGERGAVPVEATRVADVDLAGPSVDRPYEFVVDGEHVGDRHSVVPSGNRERIVELQTVSDPQLVASM